MIILQYTVFNNNGDFEKWQKEVQADIHATQLFVPQSHTEVNKENRTLDLAIAKYSYSIFVTYSLPEREKMVLVPESEYEEIKTRVEKLYALEACGVDNWVGYSDAMTYIEGE